MDYKLYSELLRESARGNFKLVNSTIISKMVELDDTTAAKIIIECCRILCKNDVPTGKEEDLYQLLRTCEQFVKTFNDDMILGCSQSLFFIIKFFLMQKKIELVIGMKHLLIAKFMDCLKTTEIVKSYANLCNIVHNAVIDLQHSETSAKSGQVFCQLCTLSLQMKSMQLSTNIALANTACFYFKTSNFLKADVNLQYNCYLTVLQFINTSKKTKESSGLEDVYSAIVKILEIVIRNLFKQHEFKKIREYVKITTSEMDKLCKIELHLKLSSILYSSSQLVVKLDTQECSKLLTSNYETCLKDLKYFSINHNFTRELQKLCNLLYIIFSNLLEYYTSVSSTLWNTYMEEHTQIVICKLLGSIGQISSQITTECRFCSNCGVKTDLYTAIMTTVLTGSLLRISINKQITIPTSLFSYVLRYLECCCTFIINLQRQGCSQWKFAWTQVGIMIYNIAAKLYSLKHAECCNYFLLLIKNLMQLEGPTESVVFKFDVLSTCLRCLSDMNIHSCQFKKALMYSAIEVLLSAEPIKAFKMWVSVKARSKDSGIEEDCCLQQLTVVCVLQENENEIKNFYSDLNVDETVARNLLMDELAQYKMIWPSKIPMLATFRKLCESADLLTLVKVLIITWGENLDSVHNDVIKIMNEITTKFELEIEKSKNEEGDQKSEKQLYLASLYAMQYYAQTRITRKKIVDEMKNAVTSEQLPLLPHEIPKNPNDECDLVSLYISLKVDQHLKTIKLLSEALFLFNNCISNCTMPIVIERLKQYNMFNFVVKIAQEFRLHCDSLQAIQAWFLCLKISRLLNNNLYILQSISFLVEETNMTCEIINELLTEAEKLKNDLSKLPSSEIWESLTTFHINKSLMLFRHQNVQAGFEEYEKALECFDKVESNGNELLKIRLDFLHVQYLQLPCDLQIEGHDVYSLGKYSRVLSAMTNYLKIPGNSSSFATTVLFEVYQSVAHMYRWMCLPREVRCYCRDTVTFAQELVIPFRTAYFLIYLAHADLLSTRLDDCQVKLNGLSNILCLDDKRNNLLTNDISEDISSAAKDINVSNLVQNFAEIMLDCPTDYKYQGSSGSPVLYMKPFKLPSCTKHSVDCDCFYCVSMEYKKLVLEYINLEAQLHIFRGNLSAAQACFNGGLEFYRNIRTKMMKFLPCYPLQDVKDTLCETICVLLLNYANSLLRTNDIKKAELFNQKLINLISKRKYENTYIYNEALMQKFVIITNKCKENDASKQQYLQVNTELFNHKDGQEMPKTPENNQTKVVFTTAYSPRPNSPPKRRLRRIKCDFSDKNSDHLIHTSREKKIKNKIKLDLSDEIENIGGVKGSIKMVCKTPDVATCSVTSYDPSPVETAKKNKIILQEIPIPSPYNKVLSNTTDKCGIDCDITDVILSSPNAYTPNSLKISSALQTRTKLLTKKLKKSAVKNVSTNNLDKNADERESASGNFKMGNNKQVRNNICKNLMSELCAAESDIGKKPLYKKKTEKQVSRINTTKEMRRTTRASSKMVNK